MSAPAPGHAIMPPQPWVRELVQASPDGALVLQGHWEVAELNRRAAELLHVDMNQAQGQDLWDLLPETIAPHHKVRCELALEVGKPYQFEVRDRFADEAVEVRLLPLSAGVLVNLVDISGQRRLSAQVETLHARYRALFDASPHPMWIYASADGRILAVNQAAMRAYGHRPQDWERMTVSDLYPEEDRSDLTELLPDLEDGAHAMMGLDGRGEPRLSRHLLASGEHVLVEVSGHRLEHDGVSACLLMAVDVTQQLHAQSRIKQLNEELQARVEQLTRERDRSNHEIESFVYAVSHDLRSPLHVVDGFAQVLMQRHAAQLDSRARHYLERIVASTRQIVVVIEELLVLSRIPRMAMSPSRVDLRPLCEALSGDMRKAYPDHPVELELDAELSVHCDRTLIVLALRCLLDNAWKFTARKPQPWVSVGLRRESGYSVLTVSDNGAGFDPAYAGKLFQPFQRLHSAADFPGSGLGLVIVERVAARHHGRVRASSELDKGAVFELWLPLPGADGPAEPEAPVEFTELNLS